MTRTDELTNDITSVENTINALGNYLSAVTIAAIRHGIPADLASHIELDIRERIEICNTVREDYQSEKSMIVAGEITDAAFNSVVEELEDTVRDLEEKPVLKLSDNVVEIPLEKKDDLIDLNEPEEEYTIVKGIEVDAATRKVMEAHENRDMHAPLKVGDIFYSSWGYDQTNIDFYEVVGVTKSGKSVKIREIAKKTCYRADTMTATNLPDAGNYKTEPKTKRINTCKHYGFTLRMSSYETAWLWEGDAKNSSHYA